MTAEERIAQRISAINQRRPLPTAEDIAYVEGICGTIRAALKRETEAYFRCAAAGSPKPAYVDNGDAALAALQRGLGLRATPSPVAGGGDRDSASAGGADAAPALDQGAVLRKMDRE